MKSKNPKADLEKSKSLFFQLGLVAALSLSLLAFEWKSTGNTDLALLTRGSQDPIIIEYPEPVIDKEPPKPVVIPKISEIINVIPDNVDIVDGGDIFRELTDADLPNILPYRDHNEDPEDPNEIYEVFSIEEKPTFMGKEYNEFSRYIGRNLHYPELLAQNGIQGMVVVQFVVDIDGTVTRVKVLKSADPLFDQEAVRVIKSSPKWEPGKQSGKPVRVNFTFPIFFQLQ